MAHHVDESRDPRRRRARPSTPQPDIPIIRDKLDIYKRENRTTVEYIVGVGMVKTTEPDSPDPERPPPLESRSFPVCEITNRDEQARTGELRWDRELDQYELKVGNERWVIPAADVKYIYFSDQPSFFLLEVRPKDLPERNFFFHYHNELCHTLRVWFSSRILDTVISFRKSEEILNKVVQIRKVSSTHAAFSTVPPIGSETSSPAPSDSNSATRHTEVRAPAVSSIGNTTPDTDTASKARPTADTSAAVDRRERRGADGHTKTTASHALPLSQSICLGNLVLRMRDPHMKGSAFKLDEDDVFDGPFKVLEMPPGGHRGPSELVKLDFPTDPLAKSRGLNPWTPMWRLRKAYVVQPFLLRGNLALGMIFEKAINSAPCAPRSGASTPDDVEVIAELSPGNYTMVDYVNPSSLGEGVYEVSKLRGKCIERVNRKELPGGYEHPTVQDSAIKRFFAQGGKLPAGQVLVVKYLVHWAGWPSEEDSWEVGENNIPQVLIDQFEQKNKDLVVEIPPNSPPKKRRR